MTYDLNALLKQRAEATGVSGDEVPFEFGDKTFTFRDPLMISDEDKDELAELEYDVDVAAFYMGEEQYADFVSTKAKITLDSGETMEVQGSAGIFMLQFQEYIEAQRDSDPKQGSRSRANRSQRRAAAGKKRK